jgi:hypothetical protein
MMTSVDYAHEPAELNLGIGQVMRRWIDRRLLVAHRLGGPVCVAEADLPS